MSDDADIIAFRTAQIQEHRDRLVAKDHQLRIERLGGGVPFANIPEDDLEVVVVVAPDPEPITVVEVTPEPVIESLPVAEETPVEVIEVVPVAEIAAETPAPKTTKPKAASKS